MGHKHNYCYGTDNAVITITADHQDEAGEILESIVKNPKDFKLFDSETVDE